MRDRPALIAALAAFVLGAAPLTCAEASPPPPPPSYVMDVARALTGPQDAGTPAKLADFIAHDVTAYVNGELVAKGKPAWLKYYAHSRISPGRVLSFSPDWRQNGTLMIVDEYDSVDRSNLPPNAVADPRMTGRATLYQFGADHKIHVIRSLVGGGFWIKP